MTPECIKELDLSIRCTRRILHEFQQDAERDRVDALFDRIESRLSQGGAAADELGDLIVPLALLRRAMIDATSGDTGGAADLGRLKAHIEMVLDVPGRTCC